MESLEERALLSSTWTALAHDAPSLNPDSGRRTTSRVIGTALPPVITQQASSNQNPVTGTQTQLQVQASDPNGANLTYTWSVTSQPVGAKIPTFNNANKNNTNVTFYQAGSYTFRVTVQDTLGLSSASSVTASVVQTPSSLSITPANVSLKNGAPQQFTAVAVDQFGQAMASPPVFTWQVNGGGGTISSTGLYTAPASGTGNVQVKVSANGRNAQANVTVTSPPAAPSNLQASVQNGQVRLQWNINSNNQTGFVIQYLQCDISNPQWTTLATVASKKNNYTFTPPANLGPTLEYRVYATNAAGNSAPSNTVTVTTPPAAPTGLTATASKGQISLSWTGSTGATSYDVYRATSSGQEGNTPIATGVIATTFTDSNVTGGTTYYYKVTAVDAAEQSRMSSEVSATLPQVPAAPTGLAVSAGLTNVSLSWNAVTGATSYDVYRATSSGQEGNTPIATGVTAPTFTDSNVTGGTTYYYEVTAVDAAGQSRMSSEVSATLPQVPAAPTGLAVSAGLTNVSLSWNAVSGATGYNIYRGTSSGGESFDIYVTSTSFNDTGLAAFTTYYYKVSAVNSNGEGAMSTEVSGTPGNDWFANNLPDPGLQALARTDFNQDGSITYNDMLGLLTQAVTETGTGTVSTAVVKSLQALANSSGAACPNMPPSVQGLASNLANGLTANTTTASQLQVLVNKWFLGEDLPTIDTQYWGTSGYVLANGTLFGSSGAPQAGQDVNGSLSGPWDVYQGEEGDCWLMASFEEIAYKQPTIIENSFTDDGLVAENGVQVHVWTYRYYSGSTPEYMTVNNYFPSNNGVFMYADFYKTIANASNVLWAPLMEKAYAGIYGDKYASLNGGYAQNVLPMETGGSSAGINFFSQSGYISAINNPTDLLTVASWSNSNGFVADHDYAVLWVNSNGTIQTFNPWGTNEPPPITYAYLTTGGNFTEDGDTVVSSAAATGLPSGKQTSGGSGLSLAGGLRPNTGGASDFASGFHAPWGDDYLAAYVGAIATQLTADPPHLAGELAGLFSDGPLTGAKPDAGLHTVISIGDAATQTPSTCAKADAGLHSQLWASSDADIDNQLWPSFRKHGTRLVLLR